MNLKLMNINFVFWTHSPNKSPPLLDLRRIKLSSTYFCALSLSLPPSLSLSTCGIVVINMEDSSRPSFRSGGGERRLEIVSGRGQSSYNGNQMYTTSRPDSPPVHRPSAVAAKPWGFGDSEMKRRKRIAKYKVYTVEGRVKASIRNGLRWIKNKCSQIIHGY